MHRNLGSKLIRVAAVLLAGGTAAFAQAPELRARMAEVLRYSGVSSPLPEEIERMTTLWTQAQTGPEGETRRLALRDMYLLYNRLHGRDLTSHPQAVDGLTRFATATFAGGGRMDLALPEPRGVPSGTYVHVDTAGSGPTHLLLISDLGVDGRELYNSFIQRGRGQYTMHVVTLPYAGAARPLPWPKILNYPDRPWLDQIERELLAMIDQPRMKGVIIVGTSAGGYFAIRLALLRPLQIRKAVVVNSLVASSMRSMEDPDAPASLAERLARVRAAAPAPQLFPIAPVPAFDELQRLACDPRSTHPTARNWMAFAVKDDRLSCRWTVEALSGGFFVPSLEYGWELTSTDLTSSMKDLIVPLLVMGSWHDAGSTVTNAPTISQWEEMKLLYPAIPLMVASFDDTRAYIGEDAPAEFDRALANFVAGREVHGKTGFDYPRTSPRATVMQAVAGAEIHISYGRPAVGGRKIWGTLVPNGRVWRAGANEATCFTVNRKVTIEGRPLPAGTYTFFMIPNEAEWTLIFNRVPRQWGAFDYNPAFDALRVAVPSALTAHEERLRYAIEPVSADAASVTLSWEKRSVTFRVEVFR